MLGNLRLNIEFEQSETLSGCKVVRDKVEKYLGEYFGIENIIDLCSNYGWDTDYDNDELLPHFINLSKQLENVVFKLYYRCFENDERSVIYIKNGKYQKEYGYIQYDPVEEKYLIEFEE